MAEARSGVVIPVVDIRPFLQGSASDKRSVAGQIGEACEAIGFFGIVGHGIQQSRIQAMWDVSRRFFELPLDEKLRYTPPSLDIFLGYLPMRTSALGKTLGVDSPPDLAESFMINRFDDPDVAVAAGLRPGREKLFHPNIWPQHPPDFQTVWLEYYVCLESLARSLMRILALALTLPEDWFENKINQHCSNLLANYYPAEIEPPLPGQIRRGEHSDFGSLTILHQPDGIPGLQVRDRSGAWLDVPPVQDGFIVNLGDLLEHWTNDRWVSTLHRVVNPPTEYASRARMSIAFFHAPNFDALIETIPTIIDAEHPAKYAPVVSGEWHIMKALKML